MSEDAVVLAKEPCPPHPTAGKDLQGVEWIGEPMGFQHGPRRSKLALFREHQSAQQVVGRYRNVPLGEPLQENLRPLGVPIEERSRRREQQNQAIARLRAHGLFGLR